MTATAREDIARGDRFAFGKNWRRFLAVVDDRRIRGAEESLKQLLEMGDLRGLSFLDVGSGSGLFSLVARRLGATVTSFDYDPESVACTRELKRRYFPGDESWRIESGSALDAGYLKSLGEFDIVYSWGVLHHTGDMWRALDQVALMPARGGRLCIAIYNDQGWLSGYWLRVKRLYCSGWVGRFLTCAVVMPYWIVRGLAKDLLTAKNPLRRYTEPHERGMSRFHDWFDWLGGLPFEVARPEAIVAFYRERGFVLQQLTTAGGRHGNNEFVFQRVRPK